jgi:hypothetical protein
MQDNRTVQSRTVQTGTEQGRTGRADAPEHHLAADLAVHVDGHPTCACGQEIDACSRAHCPRCGLRLVTTRNGRNAGVA